MHSLHVFGSFDSSFMELNAKQIFWTFPVELVLLVRFFFRNFVFFYVNEDFLYLSSSSVTDSMSSIFSAKRSPPPNHLSCFLIVKDSILKGLFVHTHHVRCVVLLAVFVIQNVLMNVNIVKLKVTWKKIAH